MGVQPRSLHPLDNDREATGYVGVPFVWAVQTVESTSTYDWTNPSRRTARVVGIEGYMTGAGGGADTITIHRVVAGTATAISDTLDVSGYADEQRLAHTTISNATNEIRPGDSLRVTTASDALAYVVIYMVWKEE